MDCCKPELVGTKEHEFRISKTAERPKTVRLKEKRGKSQGRNVEDYSMSLRWEDSLHKKVFGISQEGENAAGQWCIA